MGGLDGRRLAARVAYIHRRCADTLFDYIESPELPASMDDLARIIGRHDAGDSPFDSDTRALEAFFHDSREPSLTLSFEEIERILGRKLPALSSSDEYWHAEGNDVLSRCWLLAGYRIRSVDTQKRVVKYKRMRPDADYGKLTIPAALTGTHVPMDAIYEAEHFLSGLVKKYGL